MSTPNNGQTHGRRPSGSARSGEGTATSSPSNTSATKTAALTRQASIARKRTSLGPGTPKAGAPSGSSSNGSPAAAKTRRTSTSSTALARITSSSSSSSGVDDYADAGPGTAEDGATSEAQAAATTTATSTSTPEELSRMSRDQLVALIVRERDYKDELEVKVHDLAAEHATLSEQHDDLQKTQSLHEKKLEEAYATTARMELQLAEQNEALEGAKQAGRAAEKEGNDAQKRYLEQVELFDSERAKWEEVEQSLQAELAEMRQTVQQQSLAIENHARTTSQESQDAVYREEQPKLDAALSPIPVPLSATLTSSPTFQIPESTLEELQALHTKVALLSSEHDLAQSEAQRLQAQLEDLERMNADLQEQNENYEVLLGERMLAGLGLGALADSGVGSSANTSSLQELSSEGGRSSRPPSSLDRLDEESDDDKSDDDLPEVYETSGDGNLSTGAVAAKIAPNRITKTAQKRQSMIGFGSGGGGGLDLGAELDRARQEEEDRIKSEEKAKRKKKAAEARRRNQTSIMSMQDQEALPADVDTLRKEVKLLRQENKGLSTYVSKILERIIGIEGFEKVLSVERSPVPPISSPPPPAAPVHISRSADDAPPPPTPAKTGFASSSHRPPLPLRAQTSVGDAGVAAPAPLSPTGPPPTAGNATANKKNRFSMDWLWKSKEDAKAVANAAPATALPAASAPAPGLKPMMLSGAPAQKQSPEEDEDDRRARARLQSEMRLLGLDAHGSPASQTGTPGSVKIGAARSPGKRMSSGGSFGLGSSPRPPSLPAKQQEEDETATREKAMRHELDNGRASGFMELPPVGAPGDGVKIRGHRKRPSGNYAPAGLEPGSIGLGVSYSRASTGSTWSDRSPSLQGESEGDAGEKRSSAGSDVKT